MPPAPQQPKPSSTERSPFLTQFIMRTPKPETDEDAPQPQRPSLADRVEEALTKDPAFRIMTLDGLKWICPYTGVRVAAPFGHFEPAKQYLIAQKPWTKARLKSPADLYIFRWKLFLKEHVENDARLRIFASDGRWLNPFTSEWVRLSSSAGAYTPEITNEIALVLAKCRPAQTQPMLDRIVLEDVVRDARAAKLRGVETARVVQRAPGARSAPQAESARLKLSDDRTRARDIITRIQARLPTLPGMGFLLHYEPCPSIGGDFYHYAHLVDDLHFVAIGDVRSGGVEGAVLVVATIKALQGVIRQAEDLVDAMTRINEAVKSDLARGKYITLFAGVLDVQHRTFTCISAGHRRALLANPQRRAAVERIGHVGPALGLHASDKFKASLVAETYQLEEGDSLFLYTDGLPDAINVRAEAYGEMRVMGQVLCALERPPADVVSHVISDLKHFADDRLDDDVTILAIHIDVPPMELPDWLSTEADAAGG